MAEVSAEATEEAVKVVVTAVEVTAVEATAEVEKGEVVKAEEKVGGWVVAAMVEVVPEVAKEEATVVAATGEATEEVGMVAATEVRPTPHPRNTAHEVETRRSRSSSFGCCLPRQSHGARPCCDHKAPKPKCTPGRSRNQSRSSQTALHVCIGGRHSGHTQHLHLSKQKPTSPK